ncbi:MAG: hypothetical protein H7039_08345 [Bryobacteraceae bacterium]|nr:hypothetical protein [Bryobacteraceae bacterium]
MTHRWISKEWISKLTGLVMLVVVCFLAGPQVASAGERCNRRGYNNRGYSSYNSYNNRGYSTFGRRGSDRDYRRSSTYRDTRYSDNGYYDDNYRRPRSAGTSAAIIGGSAAAGAAIGGVTGGGKGALIGAGIGAVGGLIYDRTTNNERGR